jgi:UDP-N-acetylmuramate--alanine ligase
VSGKEHIHLVGIGGAGLSAIATVLLEQGHAVSGSDLQPSPVTDRLVRMGADVRQGHSAANLPAAATAVVISSAVPLDNPEVVAAQERGIPVFKRADWLARMMEGPGCRGVAVAGTHGKTTTTAMIAHVVRAAGLDPTFIVGGKVQQLGTNAAAGAGDVFIVEADEYDRTFLGLRPEVAVLTTLEWDHPDCYPTYESMRQAFIQFLAGVPASGVVVACGDDPGIRHLLQEVQAAGALSAPVVTYGLAADNHWQVLDPEVNTLGGFNFTLRRSGLTREAEAPSCIVSLQVPGIHNAKNAMAALVAADWLGVPAGTAIDALADFQGVERRFEVKGEVRDVLVVDDYAHHPTEIDVVLRAAKARYPHRSVWAVFQPHTFSRTRALLDDFAEAFNGADHVIVVDVFASREKSDGTLTSDHLVDRMLHRDARYLASFEEAVDYLASHVKPGAVVITLGAGDGYRIGEMLLTRLQASDGIRLMAPEIADAGSAGSALEALAAELSALEDTAVLRQEPMSKHTTWGVGGPAELWVTATSLNTLVTCVNAARRHQVPVFVLGSGSNLLVSDRGIRGLVLQNRCRHIAIDEDRSQVVADSGVNLMSLVRYVARRGYAGLEWAAGVPGTLGGAVVNNAGAHKACLADTLLAAEVLMLDGQRAWQEPAWFDYGYRSSRLKQQATEGERYLVLQARLQLQQEPKDAIDERIAKYVQHRQTTQPDGPSAGSVFKNPPGDRAGRLLEAAGCKGMQIGGAQVSNVHANFFINRGHATASDFLALIDAARARVREKFGVVLETEIQKVGDWSQSLNV